MHESPRLYTNQPSPNWLQWSGGVLFGNFIREINREAYNGRNRGPCWCPALPECRLPPHPPRNRFSHTGRPPPRGPLRCSAPA
jgi:hypothetical protein